MKKIFFPILLLVASALTVRCHAQQKTVATPKQFNYKVDLKKAGTSPQKIAALDSLLQSFVDQKKVANVAAFVAKGGDVVYKKSFGWKDMEKHIPATPDDYYILYSQTKAIVTVAFMTLVEKGLVKIDDPVSKYFPEISDKVITALHNDGTYETRPVSAPMTFIHLMSHSSGLNAGLVGNITRAETRRADSIRRAIVTLYNKRRGPAFRRRYRCKVFERQYDRIGKVSAWLRSWHGMELSYKHQHAGLYD